MRPTFGVLLTLPALATLTDVSPGRAAVSCRGFEATVLLHATKEGCTSPVGLCTKGTVESSDPSLAGATWFFSALGDRRGGGAASRCRLAPATLLPYAGSVVVTTPRDGTFKTSNAGVFDTAAGAFSQLDRVAGGTGRFAGAEGRHFFTTAAGGGDAGFKSHVRGELCLNL